MKKIFLNLKSFFNKKDFFELLKDEEFDIYEYFDLNLEEDNEYYSFLNLRNEIINKYEKFEEVVENDIVKEFFDFIKNSLVFNCEDENEFWDIFESDNDNIFDFIDFCIENEDLLKESKNEINKCFDLLIS